MDLPYENLIVVSNRLPIRVAREGKQVRIESGSGGLVRAVSPVLRRLGGVWVGWDGDPEGGAPASLLKRHAKQVGYQLRTIPLSGNEVHNYYWGFSNQTLWPLFHDLLDRARFSRAFWQAYCDANRRFARAAARGSTEHDLIWVQDYQLILAAKYLKEAGTRARLAFFLHIPFPATDLFMRLPWRDEFIDAFLLYDLIGFQTEQDRRNFTHCVRAIYPESRIRGRGRLARVERRGSSTLVGAFPISVDADDFHRLAVSPEVRQRAAAFREEMGGRTLMLGVDRLDYTKGIPYRLGAFDLALQRYPELRGELTLLQLVVPSRTRVPEYEKMKHEIDEFVGRINGAHTRGAWTPVHYIYRSLPTEELISLYRACDIALITPLRDGMNLIAKEYCASSVTRQEGVLILSEFAGAARQMGRHALLVNPYHVDHVAATIHQAFSMPAGERRRRMRALRGSVSRNDVYLWARQFLEAAARVRDG